MIDKKNVATLKEPVWITFFSIQTTKYKIINKIISLILQQLPNGKYNWNEMICWGFLVIFFVLNFAIFILTGRRPFFICICIGTLVYALIKGCMIFCTFLHKRKLKNYNQQTGPENVKIDNLDIYQLRRREDGATYNFHYSIKDCPNDQGYTDLQENNPKTFDLLDIEAFKTKEGLYSHRQDSSAKTFDHLDIEALKTDNNKGQC